MVDRVIATFDHTARNMQDGKLQTRRARAINWYIEHKKRAPPTPGPSIPPFPYIIFPPFLLTPQSQQETSALATVLTTLTTRQVCDVGVGRKSLRNLPTSVDTTNLN